MNRKNATANRHIEFKRKESKSEQQALFHRLSKKNIKYEIDNEGLAEKQVTADRCSRQSHETKKIYEIIKNIRRSAYRTDVLFWFQQDDKKKKKHRLAAK